MKVLIAGAGRLGTQIAHVLAAGPNNVTIIEQDDDRCAAIAQGFAGRVVAGDACEPSILEEAEARNTDLLIASTGDDEDNLVIGLLAKRQFAVPRVIARVNEAENGWLFDDRWGVDVAVPATTPLISLIEEAAGSADTVSLLRLARAGVNLIETTVEPASRAAGRRVGELHLPSGAFVAAVIRGGRPHGPDPDLRLEPGDELLVVSEDATEADVHAAVH